MDKQTELQLNTFILGYLLRIIKNNQIKDLDGLLSWFTDQGTKLMEQNLAPDDSSMPSIEASPAQTIHTPYVPEKPNEKPSIFVNGQGTESGDMMARMNRG